MTIPKRIKEVCRLVELEYAPRHRFYFTEEALKNVWDFKLRQVIHTVKYADGVVPLAMEELALQGMIYNLIEF
jgi:hypothetical protein